MFVCARALFLRCFRLCLPSISLSSAKIVKLQTSRAFTNNIIYGQVVVASRGGMLSSVSNEIVSLQLLPRYYTRLLPLVTWIDKFGADDDNNVAAARRNAHLGAQQASQSACQYFHPLHSQSLLQLNRARAQKGKNRWRRGKIFTR